MLGDTKISWVLLLFKQKDVVYGAKNVFMQSIAIELNKIADLKGKRTSPRAEVLGELFDLYNAKLQKIFRKKENWKRYIAYCKMNRISKQMSGLPENITKFKKTRGQGGYIEDLKITPFCILLSIYDEKTLHYLSSVGRDMCNREENFSAYLISNATNKVHVFDENKK